jgi:hypothetical protein
MTLVGGGGVVDVVGSGDVSGTSTVVSGMVVPGIVAGEVVAYVVVAAGSDVPAGAASPEQAVTSRDRITTSVITARLL